MRALMSINRSGRANANGSLPVSAVSNEIASDPSAVLLNYAVYFITLTSTGWRVLLPEEYLAGDVSSQVMALGCAHQSADPPHILSVRFIANVLGISKPFPLEQAGREVVETVCMAPICRPGQFDEYHDIHDFVRLWNVRHVSAADVTAGDVFRPSYDVIQLNLDGETKLYSSIIYEGDGFTCTYRESPTSSPIKTIFVSFGAVTDGTPLTVDSAKIQSDGMTLTTNPALVPGNSYISPRFRLWELSGVLVASVDPPKHQPIWIGLQVGQEGRTLKPVFIAQDEAASVIPQLDPGLSLVCTGTATEGTGTV